MIKLHYSTADALDECIAQLESSKRNSVKKRTSFRSSGAAASPETPINLKALQVDKMVASVSSGGMVSHSTMSTDDEDDENNGDWIDLPITQ